MSDDSVLPEGTRVATEADITSEDPVSFSFEGVPSDAERAQSSRKELVRPAARGGLEDLELSGLSFCNSCYLGKADQHLLIYDEKCSLDDLSFL